MAKKTLSIYAQIGLLALFAGCSNLLPSAPADNELLDGPVAGLTSEQSAVFIAGDVAFNDEIFTPQTGLGPIFVATSCGSCHTGDGKGHPFTTLTRFGQTDATGNKFLHLGGPQLQHRAIPGFQPEAIPAGATSTKLLPPANTGLGFLELIQDSDILARHDPKDLDGDGISGRVNLIDLPPYVTPQPWAVTINGQYIGRFGKKAAVYNLLQQTARAYNQDIGIASTFEPKDTYSGLVIDPEISEQTINDVVFYLQTLKVPIPRAGLVEGKDLMENTGCTNCHVAQFQTTYSSIAPLSYRIIYPYTDLLLHDMGPG
ncbi:MAG TPA: di-heme oxidoredictase family protein, partial [Cyclobacteriaceae bacterium]